MSQESLETTRKEANIAMSEGRYADALEWYRIGVESHPTDSNLHYGFATASFVLGDLTGALMHFKEVIRLDSSRVGAYVNLGAIYNRLEDFDTAINYLRKAIQLDTNKGEAYYNLGLVYRRQGQIDLAIQAYREAVRANPKMADAHYNLGNIYVEREQHAMAITHYKNALAARPNWEKAQNALNAVEEAKNVEGSSAHFPILSDTTSHGLPTLSASVSGRDPQRPVDPVVHGKWLRDLHHAIIELDGQTAALGEILQKEVEEAIRGVSNALLLPNQSGHNLTDEMTRFDTVKDNLQKTWDAMQKRLDRAQALAEEIDKH